MEAGLTSLDQFKAAFSSRDLMESWGQPIPLSEFPQYDWEFNGGGAFGARSQAYTTIEDRADGKYLPYYETEFDLARIRSLVRGMRALSPIASGMQTALRVYTIGEGFGFRAQSADENTPAPPAAVECAQRIIDEFLDTNDWYGSLDNEIHDRSREDGECGIPLRIEGGRILAAVIEPDQLTEPTSPGADFLDWLDDYYGIDCSSFVPSWSFGILTSARHTDRPFGYHVVYDGTGRDWDFYPEHSFQFFKRNVSRNAKRGITDWYQPWEGLRHETTLVRNTALGEALRQAIAWVEEFAAPTTQSQVSNSILADSTRTQPTANGNRSVTQTRYGGGSIAKVGAGKQFKPGPASDRDQAAQIVDQMLLRRCGVNWCMPEYMASGDASNANFASTLVAESPFVKARESDQQFYVRGCYCLLWKVLKIGYRLGKFDRSGLTWEQIEGLIDITVTPPEVATRDKLKLVQQLQAEVQLGTVSRRTAAEELGRDFDEEEAAGAAPASTAVAGVVGGNVPPAGGAAQSPTVAGAIQAAMESVETTEEARAILQQASRQLWGVYP